MDLQEIKEIIKREGGKIVIVENNKPQLMIMSFEEWRGRIRQGNPLGENKPASPPPPVVEERGEGLSIDDLPI